MNDKIYQNYFLLKINNFRTLGIFEIPENMFNFIKTIFDKISKYLIIEKSDEKKIFIFDIDNAKLVIILSQTFYHMKNGKKEYIQKEIKNNKIFHLEEFWIQFIKSSIEIEIKNVLESSLKSGILENEKTIKDRRNNVAFAQIIPNLGTMSGFGLNKDEIKNIILPLIDEYEVSDDKKKIILDIIENNPIRE